VLCELLSLSDVAGVTVNYSAKLYLLCVFAGPYLYNTDTVSRDAAIAVGVIAIAAIVLNIVQLVYICRKWANTQSGKCTIVIPILFPFSIFLLSVSSNCSANGCLHFSSNAPSTVGICIFLTRLHVGAY